MEKNAPIPMNLYFAYGSNLNLQQMKKRCPTARLLGTGTVEDYQLLIRGRCEGESYLTVEPKQGEKVPVAAFTVEPSDVEELDIYEDVAGGLYRIEPICTEISGHGMISGFWYVMNDADRLPPSQEYWDAVVEGYHDMGFDTAVLEKALKR